MLVVFDFHESYKSKVSFPLLSFVSSNGVMELARAWYFTTLRTNFWVLVELDYLQPIDVKVSQLLNTSCNK
jgi:hypothetical protein